MQLVKVIWVHEIFKKCLRSVKWSLPWLDARSNDQLHLSGCCHTQAKQCGSDPQLTSSPLPILWRRSLSFFYCIYGRFKPKKNYLVITCPVNLTYYATYQEVYYLSFEKCYSCFNKMPWEPVPSTVKGGFWFCRIDKINGVLTAWLPSQWWVTGSTRCLNDITLLTAWQSCLAVIQWSTCFQLYHFSILLSFQTIE